MKKGKRLCPYRKVYKGMLESRDEIRNRKAPYMEGFTACFGKRCMAYKKGSCLMMKRGK